MQNKANLPDAQMNISSAITMDYVNLHLRSRFKNKANTKPIKANQSQYKTNFRKDKMDVSLAITRNYNNEQRTMNNELLFKTNPIQTQFAGCSNEHKLCFNKAL